MTEYPAKSLLRHDLHQDGWCTISDLELLKIEGFDVMPESGPRRDWLAELDIPKNWEAIDAMAQPRGLSSRRIRFIVCDESPTRFQGNYQLQPRHIIIPNSQRYLTLAHLGYNIGIIEQFHHGFPWKLLCDVDFIRAFDSKRNMFAAPQEGQDTEGCFILGQARLYDSALAKKAWQGIEQKIFTHVASVLIRISATDPQGTGKIFEIALIDGPTAGCPGARILKSWEEVSPMLADKNHTKEDP